MKKLERAAAIGMLLLLIASLLPVIDLGRYNHPTGDDYYYGYYTRLVWEETGSIAKTLAEAVRGVQEQYQIWQGTYSAMFFMYLTPITFSEKAYGLVTAWILLSLTGSIFYLFYIIFCRWLSGSKECWIAAASGIALLCIQTVPSQGETFFWYNGSMYYTGFFALTLVYWGLMLGFLKDRCLWKAVLLLFLSAFLGGGNYVSLLPTMILMACLLAWMVYDAVRSKEKEWKRWKPVLAVGLNLFVLLAGFAISAAAPGNQIRQETSQKISAAMAILKSLRQGLFYARAWIRTGWVMTAVFLTPFFWKSYRKIKWSFKWPAVMGLFTYGIFCSMACPTFYSMNSTGPARVVSIVYYFFQLTTFACFYYGLGWIYRKWEKIEHKGTMPIKNGILILTGILAVLFLVGWRTGGLETCTTVKAVKSLAEGEAQAYGREYQERLAILQDPTIEDAVLKPYRFRPDMLYVGDLPDDPDFFNNQCVAAFYHKKTVTVRGEE